MNPPLSTEADLDLLNETSRLFVRSGAGPALRLHRAVDAAAARILADPASFAAHPDAPHLRRCPVGDGFPHDLLFRLNAVGVRIVAVWHPARNPADLARR